MAPCPQVLYYGLLDGMPDARNAGSCAQGDTKCDGLSAGPMRMVVMEHIEKRVVEQPALPEDAQEKIERAVQKLHDLWASKQGTSYSLSISIGLGR